MNAYYNSLHPIREHIVEWERRRRSWNYRTFTFFEVVLILAAAGSVIGVVPYLIITNTSGPLPSDTMTVLSRLAFPWVVCCVIFVPVAWIVYRKGLEAWPQTPPSLLTPEQLTFVAAASALSFMDKHADSNRPEYIMEALSEVGPVFDPAAEPLWRWDGEEFSSIRAASKSCMDGSGPSGCRDLGQDGSSARRTSSLHRIVQLCDRRRAESLRAPKPRRQHGGFVILGSVVLGAIGWEGLVGRGGSRL